MVLQAFNHLGQMRSIRGWRVDNQTPKRVGPSGYNLKGLVLADALARQILETGKNQIGGLLLNSSLSSLVKASLILSRNQSFEMTTMKQLLPALASLFTAGGQKKSRNVFLI